MTAYLFYTRCLGYQEMPPKSTQRGEEGKLKYEGKSADWPDYCYIGHKAALPEVEVPEAAAGAAAPAPPASGRPLPAAAQAAAQRVELLQAGVYRAEEHVWWDGDRLSHGTFAPDQQQRWRWPTSGNASRIVLAGDSTIVRSFAMLSGAVNAPCEVLTAPHTWVSGASACWRGRQGLPHGVPAQALAACRTSCPCCPAAPRFLLQRRAPHKLAVTPAAQGGCGA